MLIFFVISWVRGWISKKIHFIVTLKAKRVDKYFEAEYINNKYMYI